MMLGQPSATLDAPASHVGVYEQLGTWTRMLRAELEGRCRVENEGTLTDWLNRRTPHPVTVLVFGRAEALPVVRCLAECPVDLSQRGVIAVTSLDYSVSRYLLATGVVLVERQRLSRCRPLARAIQRFCESSSAPTLSLEQRIWKNLPWRAS